MTFRRFRIFLGMVPFGLAIYMAGIWVSCLAQVSSPEAQQRFEHEVAAAIKIEDMTTDIKELKASLAEIRALNLEVRLTRIEDEMKRNDEKADRIQRMVSGMLISFVGFMIQQGAKLFVDKMRK